jgi:hypothetical protein
LQVLNVGNSNLIEIVLQDEVDASYINSATASITIVDTSGNSISGETWPVSLAYVASSDGLYRATLSSSIGIVSGQRYVGEITATASGNTGYWEVPILAETRT